MIGDLERRPVRSRRRSASTNSLDELELSSGDSEDRASSSAPLLLDIVSEPVEAENEPAPEGLMDLPLAGVSSPAPELAPPLPMEPEEPAPVRSGTAPLLARAGALGADAAVALLLTAAPLLAATAAPSSALEPRALWAAGAFALYLSFFATVVPLMFFGKTIGMSLTGLTARASGDPPLTARQAAGRWLGTLAAVAGLGLPLLAPRRGGEGVSPADRISQRPIVFEEVDG